MPWAIAHNGVSPSPLRPSLDISRIPPARSIYLETRPSSQSNRSSSGAPASRSASRRSGSCAPGAFNLIRQSCFPTTWRYATLAIYARESNETPRLKAFCRVAPSVLLSVRAIFRAGIFCRASAFSSRTSILVHSRRFEFFAILPPI